MLMVMALYLFLALAAGYVAYRSLALDVPLESLLDGWAKPPSQFLEVVGQSVHYRDQGARDAPVILLLHGISASLHTWEGWVEELQKEWRVISLDLPGFGLKGPWVGVLEGQEYAQENYVDFVLQFMDELGVERFAVAGNSMGGEVTWGLSVRTPKRVTAQLLLNATGYSDAGGKFPLGWRLITWPITSVFSMISLPRFAVADGLREAVADPALVTPEKIEFYRGLALRKGNRKALQKRLRLVLLGEGVEHLPLMNVPTLIMWGAKDLFVPALNAERFLNDIPNSRIVMFDDLAHIPQEEDPKRSVAAAMKFLKSIDTDGYKNLP